jgi:hypothetical protein
MVEESAKRFGYHIWAEDLNSKSGMPYRIAKHGSHKVCEDIVWLRQSWNRPCILIENIHLTSSSTLFTLNLGHHTITEVPCSAILSAFPREFCADPDHPDPYSPILMIDRCSGTVQNNLKICHGKFRMWKQCGNFDNSQNILCSRLSLCGINLVTNYSFFELGCGGYLKWMQHIIKTLPDLILNDTINAPLFGPRHRPSVLEAMNDGLKGGIYGGHIAVIKFALSRGANAFELLLHDRDIYHQSMQYTFQDLVDFHAAKVPPHIISQLIINHAISCTMEDFK